MNRSSKSKARPRSAFATGIAIGVAAQCLWIQGQEWLRFGLAPHAGAHAFSSAFYLLTAAQAQNLGAAVIAGAIAFWLSSDLLVIGLAILHGWVLAADPWVYGLFQDHFSLTLTEGGLPSFRELWDSGLAQADGWWVANLFFAVVAILIPQIPAVRSRLGKIASRLRPAVVGAWVVSYLLLAFSASFWLGGRSEIAVQHLNWHPLARLAWSAVRANPRAGDVQPCPDPGPLGSLRFGQAPPPPDFSELRSRLEKPRKPPNLVLVILESVGSLQALRDGQLDPDRMPALSQLSDHAVTFDSIVDIFPSTIRSHVPILTGGRTPTWATVDEVLNAPYQGPTLPTILAKQGYRTALFSAQRLNTENMRPFYRGLGFNPLFDLDAWHFPPPWWLNSWGIDEDKAWSMASDWLRHTDDSHPYFLMFLTVGTHHPYDIPTGAVPRFGTQNPWDRYRNALAYTDEVLARRIQEIAGLRPQRDTVVAIMGDHGEAFGDRHRLNFLHKNFIYEENIRNFLWIRDPARVSRARSSRQIGSIGDVAPTLLAWLGQKPADMPGQDLLSAGFSTRIQYFHKSTTPELWGLRDGQWKFISRRFGNARRELYDLQRDPDEKFNRAEEFPDRTGIYDCLIRKWYLAENRDFLEHAQGLEYLASAQIPESELGKVGPKVLRFGTYVDGRFKARERFGPDEKVTALAEWTAEGSDEKLVYRWFDPQGRLASSEPEDMRKDYAWTWKIYAGRYPLGPGTWTLRIVDRASGRPLISGTFVVDTIAVPARPQSRANPH